MRASDPVRNFVLAHSGFRGQRNALEEVLEESVNFVSELPSIPMYDGNREKPSIEANQFIRYASEAGQYLEQKFSSPVSPVTGVIVHGTTQGNLVFRNTQLGELSNPRLADAPYGSGFDNDYNPITDVIRIGANNTTETAATTAANLWTHHMHLDAVQAGGTICCASSPMNVAYARGVERLVAGVLQKLHPSQNFRTETEVRRMVDLAAAYGKLCGDRANVNLLEESHGLAPHLSPASLDTAFAMAAFSIAEHLGEEVYTSAALKGRYTFLGNKAA